MPDDYIPAVDAADDGFSYAPKVEDYTAEDRAQYARQMQSGGSAIDDDEVEVDFLAGTTPEDLERGSYRPIPVGKHTVRIKNLEWMDDKRLFPHKVYVKRLDGSVRAMNFDAMRLNVTFCLPDDEMCSTRQMFVMKPMGRDQLEAYEFGFPDDKEEECKKRKREEGGMNAKRLRYFLARLGFQNDANGNLPREAGKLRNWIFYTGTNIPRLLGIEVMKPRSATYTDRSGQVKASSPLIGLFSYYSVPEPPEVAALRSSSNGESHAPVAPTAESVTPTTEAEPANPVEQPKHKPGKAKASV